MGRRCPTEKAPVGFAGSLPTGTETETGMPVEAAALGAFVLRRYDVYVDVIGGAGGPIVDGTMLSYVRYLFSKIVGRLSFDPFVDVG